MDSSTPGSTPRRRQRITARTPEISAKGLHILSSLAWVAVAAGLVCLVNGFILGDSGPLIYGGAAVLLGTIAARAASEARADRAHAAALQRIVDDLDITFVEYSNGSRTYTVNRYDDSE